MCLPTTTPTRRRPIPSPILDATTNLSRSIAEKGIFPAVDPLASTSRILQPHIVGEAPLRVARGVQKVLQRYKDSRTSSPSSAWMSCRTTTTSAWSRVARRIERFMSQPFHVAEQFTGMKGLY